jgi:hypothetical protein
VSKCFVPEKPPNNGGYDPTAEVVEGRRSTEGNTVPEAASRTRDLPYGLARNLDGGSRDAVNRKGGSPSRRGVLRRRFSTSRTRDQTPEMISEEPTDVEPPDA